MRLTSILLLLATIFSSAVYANGIKPKKAISKTSEEKYLKIIEKNVDPSFQAIAKSLIKRSSISDVKVINHRAVIALDTSGQYFQVDVKNGYDSFKKKKSLKNVTSIPFPRTEDLIEIQPTEALPTTEYVDFLKSYGITQTASDYISFDEVNLYFMTIEHNKTLGPDQKIYIRFSLTENGSSFDSNELSFGVNGCDESACWGSDNIELELKRYR